MRRGALPPRSASIPVHYDPTATAQDGSAVFDTWASVVFHGIDGQRVLCADLVEVEAADLGRVAGGFVIE